MRPIDIEYVQQRIFQSRPNNRFVISEFELALLLQMDVQRLHAKLLAATDCFDSFQKMTDVEFEAQKRILHYSKELKKNKYCYVFTEEQVAQMQTLFSPQERAFKIIPTILLAFENLSIPYEKQTKKIITQKRKAETKFYWTIAISVFVIYFILCVLLRSFLGDDYPAKYFYIACAVGLVLPALSIYFPRHKLWGWCDDKLVDKEYSNFYKTLMNQS